MKHRSGKMEFCSGAMDFCKETGMLCDINRMRELYMPDRCVILSNVTAVYKKPDSGSEMVSQAIFGENVSHTDSYGDFSLIQTPDGYSGWMHSTHLRPLFGEEMYPAPSLSAMVNDLFAPVYFAPSARAERLTLLTIGTQVEILPHDPLDGFWGIKMTDGRTGYVYRSSLIVPEYPSLDKVGVSLTTVAKAFVGVPYLWGGRTSFGLDCSGFVQKAFNLCGIQIPRDASQQAKFADFAESDFGSIQPGDAIYFHGADVESKDRVTHTGIALDPERFIHSSGGEGVHISYFVDDGYIERICSICRLTERKK
jgi:hypothetical protein